MRRKKVKPKAGDVVAVPLFDGTWGLGHVVFYDYSFIFALFGKRVDRPEGLIAELDEALAQPIAILVLCGDELRTGEWPVVGFREPSYPSAWIPEFQCEGETSYTATAGPGLLNAYHGLAPWDYFKDPKENEKMLLLGVPVPPTVRYKRDFPPPLGGGRAVPEGERAVQAAGGEAKVELAME